jgi:heat-inducible transcriptional repressor
MNTDKAPALSDRAQEILGGIVDTYTQTGQPVGSKTLVETGRLKLSPASVRNVMQDLEKMGYLTHPHTSAGRIPTEDGYRYYAKKLVEVDNLDETLKQEIKSKIKPGKNLSTIIKDVSGALSEITGCAGLVTAPKREADPLEQVEFIRLSGDRVLVVMVTASGEIENRMIEVPAFIDTNELNKASKEMKHLIAGQTLDQAREQLIANLAEQKGQVNSMIDQMMQAAHEWGQPVVSDGAMVVAGSTNLFQYPELVREKLQSLVKMFEEKRLLMALMEEVKHGQGIQVYIGQDCPLAEGKDLTADCAFVASPYSSKDKKVVGSLGVIGPMRMNYKQTIGLVNYTGQLLGQALSQQEERA